MILCSYRHAFPAMSFISVPIISHSPLSNNINPPNLAKPPKPSVEKSSFDTNNSNPSNNISKTREEKIRDTIQVSNIRVPNVTLKTTLRFDPPTSDFTRPQIPSALTVSDVSPINYEKFKIPISLYDTIMFPISISFPPLPVSQDVLIPDFDGNISLPTNEMLYIDLDKYPFNVTPTNSFNYNVKGTFLINNNVNTADEFSFIKERRYIKDLINQFMSDLDTVYNIDFLFLQLRNNYINESNKFYRHLSDKERALLKLVLTTKIYREILNYRVSRVEAVLAQTREKASLFMTANRELINLWEAKQSLSELRYKNFIDKVKKDSTLYNIVTKVNSDIRELFYFYNNLILYTVEASVLNMERERLIIDLSIATKEVDVAKGRSQIPSLKVESLQNQIKMIEERYQQLGAEVSLLNNKVQSSLAKKEFYNANLDATKSEIEASHAKLDVRGSILKGDYDIKLLERVMSNYIRLLEDYYSVMRSMWISYYDSQKYLQAVSTLSDLSESARSKVANIVRNYSMIADAYRSFVTYHSWASQMIANANITSTITETYR